MHLAARRELEMDKKNQCQTHYLACGELRELLVRKTGSPDFKPLHPGTMEIEPSGCRFEGEARVSSHG